MRKYEGGDGGCFGVGIVDVCVMMLLDWLIDVF